MNVHSRVAVHQAARIASNPYRRNFNRGNIHAQESVTAITKVIQTIKKVFKAFVHIWRMPSADRTPRRIAVKATSGGGAKNKDDPHLAKRV